MYPKLFSFGPFTFYSFGAMLAAAFLVANYLLTKEVERKKIVPDVSYTVTAMAVFLGIVGSKLFHILENLPEFFQDPIRMLANGGGLTFYGGLICSTVGIYFYLRSQKISFLRFADAVAPSLIIAYGIGRIGCLLAGDGDYGQPTKLPWAMTYPNGIVSTLASQNPDLAKRFTELYPGESVPADIPVHPAPVYETLYSLAIFALLWQLRTGRRPDGWLFFLYLALSAACRFAVETIRINNVLIFGLSQAQVLSIVLCAIGIIGLIRLSGKPAPDDLTLTPNSATAKSKPSRKALKPT